MILFWEKAKAHGSYEAPLSLFSLKLSACWERAAQFGLISSSWHLKVHGVQRDWLRRGENLAKGACKLWGGKVEN